MNRFIVTKNGLYTVSGNFVIDWDTFELLTGKKVSSEFKEKRDGKEIVLIRNKGHLYIQDTSFVKGCIYKNLITRKTYICSPSGPRSAILTPLTLNNFDVTFSTEPENWVIA